MEVSLRASRRRRPSRATEPSSSGRLLTDLVRLLPDESVTLAYDQGDGVLEVTSGRYASKVNVFSAEDFPRLPALDVPLHTIDAPALLGTIEKVARAASRDESRPVLTGILVRFEGDRLTMAATDSYRLAVKETTLGESGPDLDAIIPARALQELARLAAGGDVVSLGVHENHVVFGAGDVWLTSRRIDGQFPNYKQLLPETFEVEVTTPREPLLEVDPPRRRHGAAERAAPPAVRRGRARRLGADAGRRRGAASRSRSTTRASRSRSGSTPTSCATGSRRSAARRVQLKLINPLRPGLLAAPDESFWYLIMPIRLAG